MGRNYCDKNGEIIHEGDFLVYVLDGRILYLLQVKKLHNTTDELWGEKIDERGIGQLSFMFSESLKISKKELAALKRLLIGVSHK